MIKGSVNKTLNRMDANHVLTLLKQMKMPESLKQIFEKKLLL